MMRQMFSIGERSGLQAGQFSTRTLLLRSHAVVIAAVCGFALSCWNTRRLEGSICCSKTFIYLSAFVVPSKTCKLPIPYALMHPHTIRDAGFWTERWSHAGRSPSSLVRRTQRPWFPTRMSNLDSSNHRTLFHFETVHFKWALAHRTWRRFWTMFTYGFLFAWKSFSWHLQMARRIVFTDSGFWKYSWAHLVMSMTESFRWVMQCRLRAQRPQASNKGLRPCPLRTEISPVSLNLLMMLCTVDQRRHAH